MSEKGTDVEHIQSVQNGVRYVHAPSRIANPGPAGIFSFASTTFILSMFNVSVRGVSHPNVVVGMAVFTGGLLQFIAGMWEFPRGNVFGATAFSSYGAFWMSYATIFIPSSGILAAYPVGSPELSNAIGVYLITWFMVTVLFIIPCIKRNMSFVILLSVLAFAFALLAAAEFTGSAMAQKAGGAFGIATAMIAYYIGLSEMLEAEARPIARLPRGILYVNEP
ncbi:FUN34 transmembrane protein [Pholiota molesta]|nr:FUN34 transmembrane protein [Pholiota molesta]